MTRWATQKQIDRLTKKTQKLLNMENELSLEYGNKIHNRYVFRNGVRCKVIATGSPANRYESITLECDDTYEGTSEERSIFDITGREHKPRAQ